MPVDRAYKDFVHVCVCVPSTGMWANDFGKSLALMFSHFSLHGVPGVKKAKITLLTSVGSMLAQQRETMALKVLQSDATHILHLDSDMVFPMDTAARLLLRGKGFVSPNCTTRTMPPRFVAHSLEGKVMDSRGKVGLEEAQHTGLAVALVETRLMKRVSHPPLYFMDWVPDMKCQCGEDVFFTQRLVEVGAKIWIDHDLSQHIKHVGTYSYSLNDLKDEVDEPECLQPAVAV